MLRKLLLTLIFAAGSFFAVNAATNNGEPKPCDISGGVMDGDQKKPLNNVNVTAISNDTREKRSVVTDSNGDYLFENLKTGAYKLVFQKDGYQKVVKENVFIREDSGFQLRVEMSRTESFQLIPGFLLFEE